ADRADAVRGRRRGGASPHLGAADRLAVLLRDRLRAGGRADRGAANGRGGAGPTRRDLTGLPVTGGPPDVHAKARVDVLPRMPDAGLPHGSPARGDKAAVRENSGLSPTAPARGSPSRSRG